MIKGIIRTLIYYAISAAIAGVLYLIFGQGYAHAPGPHYLVIFFAFVGGMGWAAFSILRFFTQTKSEELKGAIFSNLIVIFGFISFIYYSQYRYSKSFDGYKSDQPILLETEVHGDTTIIRHHENIVYISVKDSVHLNFIDSAKVGLK